jgi:hypothetical protein
MAGRFMRILESEVIFFETPSAEVQINAALSRIERMGNEQRSTLKSSLPENPCTSTSS